MMESTVPRSDEFQTENEEELLVPVDSDEKCCSRDVIASIIACIGALIMGLVIGYSSPALNNQDFKDLIKEKDMWFGSLMAIGALFGGPFGGILRTKMGLKFTLIFCNVPLGVGWLLILIDQNVIMILIGRLITGVGVGAISMAVPLYVAEVSDKKRRGILGCCFQLSVTIGILVCYGIGMALKWNYLALMCLMISVIYASLMLFVPETPRWYISNKKRDEAKASLKWLYNSDQRAEIELAFLESSIYQQEAEQNEGLSCSDLRQPEIYKPVLIGMGLMVFQQMTGINAILFYLASIFSNAGFKENVAAPTVIVGVILVLSTAIACTLVDCLGRRILLFISGASMTVSLIAFGTYYYLMDVTHVTVNLNWLSLLSISAFICAFSLGWSSIPWLAGAEIMPSKAKSFGLSLTTIVNWLFVFLTTKFIEDTTKIFTRHGTMWVFGAFCVLGCIFVALCLPETKGHSLEEIQKHFTEREDQATEP